MVKITPYRYQMFKLIKKVISDDQKAIDLLLAAKSGKFFYSMVEVLQTLKISPDELYQYRANGKIKESKFKGINSYYYRDLVRLLINQTNSKDLSNE